MSAENAKHLARDPKNPTVAQVTKMNEQRGCPHIKAATEIDFTKDITELNANEAKSEYYHLLEPAIDSIMTWHTALRNQYPDGLVDFAQPIPPNVDSATSAWDGIEIVGTQKDLEEKLAKLDPNDFETAAYLVHDAAYRSLKVAPEMWARHGYVNTRGEMTLTNEEIDRLKHLVDGNRQKKFSTQALQLRVTTALVQPNRNSISFQLIINKLTEGKLTPEEMDEKHRKSLHFALALTQIHHKETRHIRKELGSEQKDGGRVQYYVQSEYFTINEEGNLVLNGSKLVDYLATLDVQHADGVIGCPGVKHVPDQWNWFSDLSRKYAYPFLEGKGFKPQSN